MLFTTYLDELNDGRLTLPDFAASPDTELILIPSKVQSPKSKVPKGSVYAYEAKVNSQADDTIAPFVFDAHPRKIDIPIHCEIKADVLDFDSGVRQESLQLSVLEQVVDPEIISIDYGYRLTFQPPQPFDNNSTITVQIDAQDNSGNQMPPYVFSFRTQKIPGEPTPTPSATPTPTITPTPNHPPEILLGGYMNTSINSSEGGRLILIAITFDDDGLEDIASVELFYEDIGTGLYLYDDGGHFDFEPFDGVYGFVTTIPAGLSPDRFLLEVRAADVSESIARWPRLTTNN